MTQTPTTLTLYDQDYLLWTEDTVNQLRNKSFHHLDLANLIEEIEDLGKSQKRELKRVLPNLSCKKQKINDKTKDSIKAEYNLKIL